MLPNLLCVRILGNDVMLYSKIMNIKVYRMLMHSYNKVNIVLNSWGIVMINYNMPCMGCSAYGMDFTPAALKESLRLVKEAVQGEREDEITYDYLISKAPTQEERDIITSIRNDERNHRKWYKEIYKCFTGQDIESTLGEEEFKKPECFIDGIRKALFGELSAMERYRIIRQGLPSRYYRDLVFQILSDEIKHAIKYNYILDTNLYNMLSQK
jgi:rubrerythrin